MTPLYHFYFTLFGGRFNYVKKKMPLYHLFFDTLTYERCFSYIILLLCMVILLFILIDYGPFDLKLKSSSLLILTY